VKTTDGQLVPFPNEQREGPIELVPPPSPEKETWRIPGQRLVLSFKRKGEGYLLTGCRPLGGQ
jgi:hypothetical protein